MIKLEKRSREGFVSITTGIAWFLRRDIESVGFIRREAWSGLYARVVDHVFIEILFFFVLFCQNLFEKFEQAPRLVALYCRMINGFFFIVSTCFLAVG